MVRQKLFAMGTFFMPSVAMVRWLRVLDWITPALSGWVRAFRKNTVS